MKTKNSKISSEIFVISLVNNVRVFIVVYTQLNNVISNHSHFKFISETFSSLVTNHCRWKTRISQDAFSITSAKIECDNFFIVRHAGASNEFVSLNLWMVSTSASRK